MLFPIPGGPIITVVSLAFITKDVPYNTSSVVYGAVGYLKCTLKNSIFSSNLKFCPGLLNPFRIFGFLSMTSKMILPTVPEYETAVKLGTKLKTYIIEIIIMMLTATISDTL